MKIGDLRLNISRPTEENEKISEFIKNNTVISAFERTAYEYPDKKALFDGTEWFTYKKLKSSADKVSALINSLGIKEGSFIAVMAERKNIAVALMLGIMKSGCAYVPVDPELPEKRILEMLKECCSPMLFFSGKYIRTANNLQWGTPDMKDICCVDADEFESVIESTGEIMDESLWDSVAENAESAVQAGGWKDPYTGEWISDELMESFSVNVYEKLRKYTDKNCAVMEIGSASGLSLKRLAPLCGKYFATDISSSMLSFLKETVKGKHDNVEMCHTPAHEIDVLEPNRFDVIIINSVAQSFPGHNYMRDVMKKCDRMLNDGGVIFLGNIYDAGKKSDFERSFLQYKMNNPGSNVKTHFDSELFFHKDFFTDWAAVHSYTSEFSATNVDADFFSYGYDVILVKDGHPDKPLKKQHCLSAAESGEIPDRSENTGAAYGIFTSGTTGTPKGVQIVHRSVLNLAETLYEMIYKDGEVRTGVFPAFSFDPSVQQIFPALIYGSEVVIIPEDVRKDPAALYSYVNDNDIKFIDLTPSAASLFAGYALENDLECPLQYFIVGGELFTKNLAKELFRWSPSLNIFNAYGPTECCVSSAYYKLDSDKLDRLPAVPIGSPVKNSEILILDDSGNPVPEGLQGEICVSGAGVSPGYINDIGLTDTKFIKHPLNPEKKLYRTGDIGREYSRNLFMFSGRKDTQVKVRGYRIELSEIERRFSMLAGIKECTVVCRDFSGSGNNAVAVYFTSDAEQDVINLKTSLAETLPEYMIPEYMIRMDFMPLNENGKTDVKALPLPDADVKKETSGEKPFTENQKKIAGLMKQLTGLNGWDIDDNFFDNGGNSILAVRLISMIHGFSGKRIPLTYLMKYPTIRLLAAYLENTAFADTWAPLIPVSTSAASDEDIYCFHPVGGNSYCYHHLSAELKNMYRITMTQAPGLTADSAPFADCTEAGGFFSKEIMKSNPGSQKILVGWSYGALVAYEAACQMAEEGNAPKGLVIIDMTSGNSRITKKMLETASGRNRILADLLGFSDIDPEKVTDEEMRAKALKLGIETGFFPEGMEEETCDRLLRVAMANAQASVTYTPGKYCGEVLLIRASQITRSSFIDAGEDSFLGWKNYISDITLKWVEGTHETVLSPEIIPETARYIKDFIKRLK